MYFLGNDLGPNEKREVLLLSLWTLEGYCKDVNRDVQE